MFKHMIINDNLRLVRRFLKFIITFDQYSTMEMKRIKSEDTQGQDFENRKSDHIELAFQSQQNRNLIDSRFYYEPIMEAHSKDASSLECTFAGFDLKLPLWVSSMTGGTEKAGMINHRLAQVCGEYGMGMGLGSCRILLENEKYFNDFDVKELLGNYPLFANVGIAQMEEIAINSRWYLIKDLIKNFIPKLEDGDLLFVKEI